jgi:hypothetical protein
LSSTDLGATWNSVEQIGVFQRKVFDWLDKGFQERWITGEVAGMPYVNGISQISV